MAKPQSAGDWTLTPEQLQAIFRGALGGRAAAPSIEVCGGLIPMLAGLRKTDDPDWAGGEQLGPKARDASVTLRNKLPEAEAYWRSVFAGVPGEVDRVARKFAALRAALHDCDDVLGPVPMPYKQRWDEFVVLVVQVFDQGMSGIEHDFGLWIESPRVIFVHRVIAVLGWKGISPSTVLKNLVRGRDKSV